MRLTRALSPCSVLSWDDYFMSLAFLTAQRSKDPNKQVRLSAQRWRSPVTAQPPPSHPACRWARASWTRTKSFWASATTAFRAAAAMTCCPGARSRPRAACTPSTHTWCALGALGAPAGRALGVRALTLRGAGARGGQRAAEQEPEQRGGCQHLCDHVPMQRVRQAAGAGGHQGGRVLRGEDRGAGVEAHCSGVPDLRPTLLNPSPHPSRRKLVPAARRARRAVERRSASAQTWRTRLPNGCWDWRKYACANTGPAEPSAFTSTPIATTASIRLISLEDISRILGQPEEASISPLHSDSHTGHMFRPRTHPAGHDVERSLEVAFGEAAARSGFAEHQPPHDASRSPCLLEFRWWVRHGLAAGAALPAALRRTSSCECD